MSTQFVRDDRRLTAAFEKIINDEQLNQNDYDIMVAYASLTPKWYEKNLKEVKQLAQDYLKTERYLGYKHCRYINM